MISLMSSDRDYKVIIIGAGPAGLFAAIRLAQAVRCDILVLERSEKPARKLLASGSGQCNISHAGPIADFLSRYGGGEKAQSAARFLKPALFGFDNRALLDWFGARGIEFETEENGKIFPADRRASSILKVLQGEARNADIAIETKSRACAIGHGPEGFAVHVEGRVKPYRAPLLLLATGGITYPKTGSSGDGYAFAASLGHRIRPPRPALAPVYIRGFSLEPLAGHSFRDAQLGVLRAGKRIAARGGDLLITHQGLSGPVILDSSRHIIPGDILEISFLPDSIDEFRKRLDAELQAKPRRLVRLCLPELGLTKNMAELFCELAQIPRESTAATLPRASRDALCRLACAHSFPVAGLGSLDIAMVTAGGVDLAEVNSQTMESRLLPGLFFAGEILDFDGDTGGYNLQAAFSTGALAASSMGKRIS
jgi:predicted Rossmann fold flavoprotein